MLLLELLSRLQNSNTSLLFWNLFNGLKFLNELNIKSSLSRTKFSIPLKGPDLNPIGPCSVKCGTPPSHKFSDINVQKHSVDTCELYAILRLLSELRVKTRLSAFESLVYTYSWIYIHWTKLLQHCNTARKLKVQQFWITQCGIQPTGHRQENAVLHHVNF